MLIKLWRTIYQSIWKEYKDVNGVKLNKIEMMTCTLLVVLNGDIWSSLEVKNNYRYDSL